MLDYYNFLRGETANYLKKVIGIGEFSQSSLLFKPIYGEFAVSNLKNNDILPTGSIYLLKIDDEYRRGYRYLPNYRVRHYKAQGGNDPFPKKHYTDCETINEYTGFVFSNAKKNKVIDTDYPIEIHPDCKLNHCRNCQRKLYKELHIDIFNISYDEYVLSVEENDSTRVTQTGTDGYVLNWKEISTCFRNSKNWACERCSIKVEKEDFKWLHVHHINYIKTDNKRTNLKCLCVECHANVDDIHRRNFSIDKWPEEIIFFRGKYRKNSFQL